MKAWGIFLVGLGAGVAGACGSSNSHPTDSDNSKAGAGGTSSGGKAGMTNGASGSGGTSTTAGKGGSKSTGGSAGQARGGSGGKGGGGGKGGSTSSGGTGNGSAEGGDSGSPPETGGSSAGVGGSAGTSGGGMSSGGVSGSMSNAGAGDEAGVGPAGASGTGPLPTAVTFTVDTSADVHAISPLIYGVNPIYAACSDSTAHFGLCRLGGNRWSTYNWENNASNGGNLLCFQNDAGLGGGDSAAGAVTQTVSEADGIGATTLVTLPILDYVAADKSTPGSGLPDCTGDVRNSGDDYLSTRFVQNVAVKGAPFVSPPDTTDGFVYSDEFVSFLHDNVGTSHLLFGLDNQPALWGSTDAEIHPTPATYAEVVQRNVTFAKSTRDQWPEAEISGYVGYGYLDFVNLQYATDADGNGLFVDYYLTQLAQASADDGRRLIDYLDVHWYSEVYVGDNRIIYDSVTPDDQRARVQAPRSLWDSSYVENSWLTGYNGGAPLRIVRSLEEHIDANYPGTKLAVSEWGYGGGTDISGAVAAADALGIFGRDQVGLAAWATSATAPDQDAFILAAFQMFRNYDGAGAAFGDTSVSATSSAIDAASVYASVDSGNPNRVVIVAINRNENDVTATLDVADAQTFTSADVFALTAASPTPSPAASLTPTSANGFTYVMPGYSVSVIVPKT